MGDFWPHVNIRGWLVFLVDSADQFWVQLLQYFFIFHVFTGVSVLTSSFCHVEFVLPLRGGVAWTGSDVNTCPHYPALFIILAPCWQSLLLNVCIVLCLFLSVCFFFYILFSFLLVAHLPLQWLIPKTLRNWVDSVSWEAAVAYLVLTLVLIFLFGATKLNNISFQSFGFGGYLAVLCFKTW